MNLSRAKDRPLLYRAELRMRANAAARQSVEGNRASKSHERRTPIGTRDEKSNQVRHHQSTVLRDGFLRWFDEQYRHIPHPPLEKERDTHKLQVARRRPSVQMRQRKLFSRDMQRPLSQLWAPHISFLKSSSQEPLSQSLCRDFADFESMATSQLLQPLEDVDPHGGGTGAMQWAPTVHTVDMGEDDSSKDTEESGKEEGAARQKRRKRQRRVPKSLRRLWPQRGKANEGDTASDVANGKGDFQPQWHWGKHAGDIIFKIQPQPGESTEICLRHTVYPMSRLRTFTKEARHEIRHALFGTLATTSAARRITLALPQIDDSLPSATSSDSSA